LKSKQKTGRRRSILANAGASSFFNVVGARSEFSAARPSSIGAIILAYGPYEGWALASDN
jgi:hypothetical protein